MALEDLFTNKDVLESAWERTCAWYSSADWAPQPEFAAWQLNTDAWLNRLGEELAAGKYQFSPMPLVPYPKKGGRLRHYCQPHIEDQVAMMVLGVVLAPVFEGLMNRSSFGNRWYRGVGRSSTSNTVRWELRKWSLADKNPYQPYRRAHGLFRKVANWTVEQMLHRKEPRVETNNPVERAEDYRGIIPASALSGYWSETGADRVYWARVDLRYAYPSVRMNILEEAFQKMLRRMRSGPIRRLRIEDSLGLYPNDVRTMLLDDDTLEKLVHYLNQILASIRYINPNHDELDKCCFPEEADNPFTLPSGDGELHPGLPTGLALSPFLLNVYLDEIDWRLAELRTREGIPFSFVRFSDDIILLSTSRSILINGLDILYKYAGPNQASGGLNLRINRDKTQPTILKELLTKYDDQATEASTSIEEWFSNEEETYRGRLDQSAVTDETRDPFVTNLVERLSALGGDKELDCLPDNAREKLAQLEDIIILEATDDGVPRETQLVFSATQLARSWLPEESAEGDYVLLSKIRRCIAEAVHDAPDKPKLWRPVIQAAVRHPLPKGQRGEQILKEDVEESRLWLTKLLTSIAVGSDGFWVKKNKDPYRHHSNAWPYFSSYHRSAFWNAFALLGKELARASAELKQSGRFVSSHTWIFRAFSEESLLNSVSAMRDLFRDALVTLYADSSVKIPFTEACNLAVASLAIIPRSAVAQNFQSRRDRSDSFMQAVATLLSRTSDESELASEILRRSVGGPVYRASLRRLLWLAYSDSNDIVAAEKLQAEVHRKDALLRLLVLFDWALLAEPLNLYEATFSEIDGHRERLERARKKGFSAAHDELKRYSRARSIWLTFDRESE